MTTAALRNTIETCVETRSWLARSISKLLRAKPLVSEQQFAAEVTSEIRANSNLHPEGWYAPPPAGVAALFTHSDSFDRLRFDNLRKEEYWPRADRLLETDSAGLIYASPINKFSGTIGDFGMTVYRGTNTAVQSHLAKCLYVLESACELAQVGMEFRELHDLTQGLFEQAELHNARTVTLTDKVGTNLGHTIPWSYEEASPQELEIIRSGALTNLRQLISSKRVNVNRIERFKIPENIAFTLEARLESSTDPEMPNTLYHLIITFQNGVRKICGNFNGVFVALGMDSYIKSRF